MKRKKDRHKFEYNIFLKPHRTFKSHFVFLFIKLVLEKAMFLFELKNILKIFGLL